MKTLKRVVFVVIFMVVLLSLGIVAYASNNQSKVVRVGFLFKMAYHILMKMEIILGI